MSSAKFKVGDKVIVKSLDWYNENKNESGVVNVPCCFTREMSRHCGKILTIESVTFGYYTVKETGFNWSDEMFEELTYDMAVYPRTKNVEDLPKYVTQCASTLNVEIGENTTEGFMSGALAELQKLLICRNAYWLLADNWSPNYRDATKKHCIVSRNGRVSVATATETNRVFAFPTAEMANMFYKNFKDRLENCKEML